MSMFADSIEDDLLMCGSDQPRTLGYHRRSSGDVYAAAVTLAGAVRETVATAQQDSAGAIVRRGSVTYHVQAKQLSYVAPAPGDRLTEGAAGYSIDGVDVTDEGARYVLRCTAEVG